MPSDFSLSRTSLQGGIAVTTSAALSAGLGFAAIYFLNQVVVPVALVLTSAAGMGLVAGFISRWSLEYRGRSIRWLVSVVGLSIGFVFLGWLSGGKLGFDLGRGAEPNWSGLGQLALGASAAWLAVRAWGREARAPLLRWGGLHIRDRGLLRSQELPSGELRAALPSPIESNPRVTSPASSPSRVRRTPRKQRTTRIRSGRKPAAIRLSRAVEHRCPYCLDVVEISRSARVCPVCRTPHHAECWSVTGSCQVPHHQ